MATGMAAVAAFIRLRMAHLTGQISPMGSMELIGFAGLVMTVLAANHVLVIIAVFCAGGAAVHCLGIMAKNAFFNVRNPMNIRLEALIFAKIFSADAAAVACGAI